MGPTRDAAATHTGEPAGGELLHASVLSALEASAARHGARAAITAIDVADPHAPVRHWSYQRLVTDVRRAARLFTALAGDAAGQAARRHLALTTVLRLLPHRAGATNRPGSRRRVVHPARRAAAAAHPAGPHCAVGRGSRRRRLPDQLPAER